VVKTEAFPTPATQTSTSLLIDYDLLLSYSVLYIVFGINLLVSIIFVWLPVSIAVRRVFQCSNVWLLWRLVVWRHVT